MGGDLLWHNTVWASAAEDHDRTGRGKRYDFDPMFAGVRSLVTGADVALCHEEVPFAAPGQPLQNFPVFAAPPEAAAMDRVVRLRRLHDRVQPQPRPGLRRAGAHRRPARAGRGGAHRDVPTESPSGVGRCILTTEDGVRIGVVAGTFGTNGFPLPAGREWSVSMWDAPNLLAQAHAARAAGADVVVVHLHGGDEYDHQPNAAQTALVERLTRSPDVDLVLGDHAHVVQPITRVHGKWVVYGMGNMVAQQDPARADTYQGILVRFTFTERRSGRFAVTRAAYAPIGWNALAPRLRTDPRRAAPRRGRRRRHVVRRGAGRAAGAAPALSVSRRCRRSRPAGSPRPRRPGPRRRCRRT